MPQRRFFASAILSVAFVASGPGLGAEPFRYPEAKHGRGELRYINSLPVLLVQGMPAELGEQVGALALKPATGLTKLADRFVKGSGWERLYPVLLKTGNIMLPQFPPDHRTELEEAAKASGWPKDLLVFANTIPDLRKLAGCSALLVEPARSATGGPLFGRNVDARPIGPLHEYTLVMVYRPAGKRAFASIVYPGMLGCASGMNDAGLALAELTVTTAADGSVALDPAGVPFTLALRRVLEECRTVEDAEKLLRSLKRTVRQNVAVCDQRHAVVFEITPKTLAVRPADGGVCACTNHFRTIALATQTDCPRYTTLVQSRGMGKLNVADVARQMDAVNQGAWTLETMVFETAALKLHLAFGKGPATRLPLHTLDLKDLFATEQEQK
jgi:isopenicillin-N N-acyltransferase-like protein